MLISADTAATELAARLHDPSRVRPVVVVSTPAGRREPWIDAQRIRDEVGDLAEVHVIVTGGPSWAFSKAMAPGTQVYGGAGRVYPVGTAWVQDLSRSPLRFAYSAGEAKRATDRLIDDALAAAMAGGAVSATKARETRQANGVVLGCPTDSQAWVRLSDGGDATIQVGLVVNGVLAGQVFAKGMEVAGRFDIGSRQLLIERAVPTADEASSWVAPGELLPVRVIGAEADACDAALLPGVVVRLERSAVTANPLDRVDDLLTVDDIVALRRTDDSVGWTLLDVDDDEPCRPALSILPGGPPWLEDPHLQQNLALDVPAQRTGENDPESSSRTGEAAPEPGSVDELVLRILGEAVIDDIEREAADGQAQEFAAAVPTARPSPALLDPKARADGASRAASTATAPAPSGRALQDTQAALAQARARNAVLEAAVQEQQWEVRALRQELDDVRRMGDRLEDDVRRLRRANRRKASRSVPQERPVEAAELFPAPEDAFRWEVEQAWVHRIPASEKKVRPLRPYELGPRFLESLAAAQGVSRAKVVDVVVEVVCGLVDEMPGRDVHPLRTGTGGSDAPVRREDGAICWRAAIQQGTPSARRLHYWRTKDGMELSRVVLHDDMDP